MINYLIESENDINDNVLFYIEDQARLLLNLNEFDIQNYMDSELFNPEVLEFLEDESIAKSLENEPEIDNADLILNNFEKNFFLNIGKKIRFKKLKNKIRKIICKAIKEIKDLDAKEIIGAILLALIPAFGSGIPALLFPFIIGFIALILKYGVDYVCPI
ncbi:MAG: hypothetical protein ACXIUD_00320 [Mongoliitalea sp.]